jgi:hypothetical protein
VRGALLTLPWVEKGTVVPDVGKQQVRFAVKDKKLFDKDQLKKAIDETGFQLGEILSGP